jgi:hypothetical protein
MTKTTPAPEWVFDKTTQKWVNKGAPAAPAHVAATVAPKVIEPLHLPQPQWDGKDATFPDWVRADMHWKAELGKGKK